MSTKQPGWEGALLAFAAIFTVLIGLAYFYSLYFRTPVPWLAIIALSVVATAVLLLVRRRRP